MTQELNGTHNYFDIIVSGGTTRKLAQYNTTFNDKLLDKCSNYTLAIDRFRIPLSDIQLMTFDQTTNAYTVELEYNGVFSGRTAVEYLPTTNTSTSDPAYWYIWTYDAFIIMVNNALSKAFTTLAGLTTLPTGATTPFVTVTLETRTLSINGQSNFYDSTLALPIKVYMNQKLWSYFDGIIIREVGNVISTPATNGRDAMYLFYNMYNNIKTFGTGTYNSYYQMQSDNGYESMMKWNIAKGFYFTSNNMPVRHEIMPTLEFDVNNKEVINNNLNGLPVICNFDLAYSNASPKPIVAQYVLNTPYKIIDLIGDIELRKIDIQIFWYDQYNRTYPLYIKPEESMTIRLIFQQKNIK